MNKNNYTSEKAWLKDNIIYKPLSASGYLGIPRGYSIPNLIFAHEMLFRDYVSDNADNSELLKYIGINDNYSLDEFLNFDYRYNNFGFRDDVDYTIDNSENEIWCFGCSWTAGVGIPKDKAWPTLIEKETGLTVKNFGVGGCGAPTIVRLIENWLKFSKYKPKHILILGYFEQRYEIDAFRGDYRRFSFFKKCTGEYDNLVKSDKLKIKNEKNKFRNDPDGYVTPYVDKINNIVKEYDSVTINVYDYDIKDYSIGRDLDLLSLNTENAYNNDKIKKKYYSMTDELLSTLLNNKHERHINFSKSWIAHLGPDLQQAIANDFLRNLTI